jgi:hypothetical protein
MQPANEFDVRFSRLVVGMHAVHDIDFDDLLMVPAIHPTHEHGARTRRSVGLMRWWNSRLGGGQPADRGP